LGGRGDQKLKAEHEIVLYALEVANTTHARVVRVGEVVEALKLSGSHVRKLRKTYDRSINIVVHKILDQLLARGIVFSPGQIARHRYYGSEDALAPKDRALPVLMSRRQRVLEQVRITVNRLGRAVLMGEILQDISGRGALPDVTRSEISQAVLSLKQTGELRPLPLPRGDDRGSNLYLPAELNPDDYIPSRSVTWLQVVSGAFEDLWQERMTQAMPEHCLPRPISTGEVRARLLSFPIPHIRAQRAISVINAMIQLSQTGGALIRKINRPGQKSSLWAPLGFPDEQLDLGEAYANDSERIGAAVRRAVKRIGKPVNIRDIKEELKLDAALHPTGTSDLYEILSDLSKELIDMGDGTRREARLRRIFHVGRVNGNAYFYHSRNGLEDARFYVQFSQIKSDWSVASAAEQLSSLESCSLPSIAFGRAMLIEVDAVNSFQRLNKLLDSAHGDATTRGMAERLYEEVHIVRNGVRNWLASCSGRVTECPSQVSTKIPTWTSREMLPILTPLYPSAQKLNDSNRLVGLLKKVRRIPNPVYTHRFSKDHQKAVEYVFDQTDVLLFAATRWGGHECCFQAMLAKSQLGLLRDPRFVFPVLKRESFEDRLVGVACLAFLWSVKGNQLLRSIATTDPNPSVRQSALWACGFAGVDNVPDILSERSKNDPSASVRDFAKAATIASAEVSWWAM
jgi:hypothetical protein